MKITLSENKLTLLLDDKLSSTDQFQEYLQNTLALINELMTVTKISDETFEFTANVGEILSNKNLTTEAKKQYLSQIKKDTPYINSQWQLYITMQDQQFESLRITDILDYVPTAYSPYLYLTLINCDIKVLDVDYSLSEFYIKNSIIDYLHKDDSYFKGHIVDSTVSLVSNYIYQKKHEQLKKGVQLKATCESDPGVVRSNQGRVYVNYAAVEPLVLSTILYIKNSRVCFYNPIFSVGRIFCGTGDMIELDTSEEVVDLPERYTYIPENDMDNALFLLGLNTSKIKGVVSF